jgi:itaconyl-CoA hydratase
MGRGACVVERSIKPPRDGDFPIARKGHAFEEFAVGQRYTHHWGRTITEADNVMFSTGLCFWNPMGLNAEYAKAHGHPGVVVNPMLVCCVAVGLSVEDLSEAGGMFVGIDDCTFARPVYVGDTITSVSTVISTRESGSRPDFGIVGWTTEAFNQRGETVLTLRRANLVVLESAR